MHVRRITGATIGMRKWFTKDCMKNSKVCHNEKSKKYFQRKINFNF